MTKNEFSVHLEEKMVAARKRISSKMTKSDRMDSGRVAFLTALKHVVDGAGSPEDLGTLDAVNDVLQDLGMLAKSKTFLAMLEP